MLFCVKWCQNVIHRSCLRWCVQMKIKFVNDVKFCVHGCNIFQKILEFFEEISWVTWRAINTNQEKHEFDMFTPLQKEPMAYH